MPYTLPVAVDVYWRTYVVPSGQIPNGLATVAGLPFLQFNTHRVGLLITTGSGPNQAFISDKEFGFASALALPISTTLQFDFPPRNTMFLWATGVVTLSYMELIMQPFRQGVSPEDGGGIRSNVQNPG